jgi:hypothetical protein
MMHVAGVVVPVRIPKGGLHRRPSFVAVLGEAFRLNAAGVRRR